jgi:hypothetical protein
MHRGCTFGVDKLFPLPSPHSPHFRLLVIILHCLNLHQFERPTLQPNRSGGDPCTCRSSIYGGPALRVIKGVFFQSPIRAHDLSINTKRMYSRNCGSIRMTARCANKHKVYVSCKEFHRLSAHTQCTVTYTTNGAGIRYIQKD